MEVTTVCTGPKKEAVIGAEVEEKAKAESEFVKIGAVKQGNCCDPDCGPSTCGS